MKRFVFTSTGLVYGSNGGRLAQEDDPCAPTAAYPVSKLGAERFLLALASDRFDVRVLRLPFVKAPDLATLFASAGAPPPDGSNADAARPFDALLDGRRIREDLGFHPQFPRLADAMAAGG